MKVQMDELVYSFKNGFITKENFINELSGLVAQFYDHDIKDKLYAWVFSRLK